MFRISLKGKLQSKIDWLIIKFNFFSFCRNPKKSNVSQPATSIVNVVKSEEWKTRKFVVFRWKSPINEVLFTIETVIRISGPIHQVQFVSHCEKKYGELVHDSHHHHEWLLQKLSECVATLVTCEQHGDDEDSSYNKCCRGSNFWLSLKKLVRPIFDVVAMKV